jgi:hypothetical protein
LLVLVLQTPGILASRGSAGIAFFTDACHDVLLELRLAGLYLLVLRMNIVQSALLHCFATKAAEFVVLVAAEFVVLVDHPPFRVNKARGTLGDGGYGRLCSSSRCLAASTCGYTHSAITASTCGYTHSAITASTCGYTHSAITASTCGYGWTGQQSGSGLSDLAPSILHYNWF